MIFRFCCGSVTPARAVRNWLGPVHDAKVDVEVVAEGGDHAFSLVLAEQAVVHEDARSWSPMALCSSEAVTEESTPPLRPQITWALPTCR